MPHRFSRIFKSSIPSWASSLLRRAQPTRRESHVLALFFMRLTIRYLQQLLRLVLGQPVAESGYPPPDVRDIGQVGGLFGREHPWARASVTSLRTAARRTLTVEGTRPSMELRYARSRARVSGRPQS